MKQALIAQQTMRARTAASSMSLHVCGMSAYSISRTASPINSFLCSWIEMLTKYSAG